MSLPPLNFSADEATAIAVALAASGPIPFGDAARSALRKLVAAMSAANREGARELVATNLTALAGDARVEEADRLVASAEAAARSL